jgi:hypothetical protein
MELGFKPFPADLIGWNLWGMLPQEDLGWAFSLDGSRALLGAFSCRFHGFRRPRGKRTARPRHSNS